MFDALDIAWRGLASLRGFRPEWQGVRKLRTPSSADGRGGGEQSFILVNELAVYKLAFRSNKPQAEAFTDRVVAIVATIRKTGRDAPRDTGAYVRITADQMRAISSATDALSANWVLRGEGARQGVYNHLRNVFGVRSVEDLPVECFDAAMALIASKREAVGQYLAFLAESRDWFSREVLSGGTPWTPAIAARLTRARGRRVQLPPRVDWQALARAGGKGADA